MDSLIADARAFLPRLAAHNTREWWADHKAEYDRALKAPALALLEEIRPHLTALTELPVKTKLFRPHRDVRFSKDKTPFTTHLHMMWQIETGARQDVVFFFGIGLDYITAGAGMMAFDKAVLVDWRKFADLDADRLLAVLDGVIAKGAHLNEPELKRVPPPHDPGHKAAHLLRMKGLRAQCALPLDATLPDDLMARFSDLWPLNQLLIQVAEA